MERPRIAFIGDSALAFELAMYLLVDCICMEMPTVGHLLVGELDKLIAEGVGTPGARNGLAGIRESVARVLGPLTQTGPMQ